VRKCHIFTTWVVASTKTRYKTYPTQPTHLPLHFKFYGVRAKSIDCLNKKKQIPKPKQRTMKLGVTLYGHFQSIPSQWILEQAKLQVIHVCISNTHHVQKHTNFDTPGLFPFTFLPSGSLHSHINIILIWHNVDRNWVAYFNQIKPRRYTFERINEQAIQRFILFLYCFVVPFFSLQITFPSLDQDNRNSNQQRLFSKIN